MLREYKDHHGHVSRVIGPIVVVVEDYLLNLVHWSLGHWGAQIFWLPQAGVSNNKKNEMTG